MATNFQIDIEAFCKESGMLSDVGDFGSMDFNFDFNFDSSPDINTFFDGENPFAARAEGMEPTLNISQYLDTSSTAATAQVEPILDFSQFIDDSAYTGSDTVQGESQAAEIFSSAETENTSTSPWNEPDFPDIEQPEFALWPQSHEVPITTTNHEPLHIRRRLHIDPIDTTMTATQGITAENGPDSPPAKRQKTIISDEALMELLRFEIDKHTPTAYLVALPSRTPSPKSN